MTWLFAAIFLTGCGVLEWKDRAIDALIAKVPDEFEVELGEYVLPTILPPEAMLQDPAIMQLLVELLQPLIQPKSKNDDLPQIRLVISKDKTLNAFAIPGGILIFNVGLLEAAGSAEEILGVAAHKLAHVSERHVLKSMIQGLSLYAAITLLLNDVEGVAAFLVQQAHVLLQNGFSRKQEAEADEKGFEYLVHAGIDPHGLVRFFQRLQNKQENRGGKSAASINNFLSTHPLTENRIKRIKDQINQLTPAQQAHIKPVAFDLKNFQKMLP